MLAEHLTIRDATEADAAACAAIYGPYVRDTCISFEVEPPTADEMARRIASAVDRHAWFVLEDAGRVVGFAYGHAFKERAAYRWSCETSIYLEAGRRRTGGGRALYETLLARLADRGYQRVFAGMTLPNEASAGIHRALGFEAVGVYRRVGWKHGAWHDVAWVQKSIGANQPPTEPH
jgi:L-amino acid N-acyltransferase YncA